MNKQLEKQLQKVANKLSKEYNIPNPTIKLDNNTTRSQYYPDFCLIKVAALTSRNIQDSFLHEFAHHVNQFCGGKGHDKKFKLAMWSVACNFYLNPFMYSWQGDYKSVQQYFSKQLKKHIYSMIFIGDSLR